MKKKKSLSTFWNEPRIPINNQASHGISSKNIDDFTLFCIKKNIPLTEEARTEYYEKCKRENLANKVDEYVRCPACGVFFLESRLNKHGCAFRN